MKVLEELDRLVAPFAQRRDLFDAVVHIPTTTTPQPYKRLLVHDHHMTLAMEEQHCAPVKVHVLERAGHDHDYARTSALTVPETRRPAPIDPPFPGERVVQFGCVLFHFEYVTLAVRDAITAEQTPLGKVLIDHNVLRHIDLGAILRLECGPALAKLFGCPRGTTTYGRLATIFCDRHPAVDLLEISTPLE